MRPRGVGKKGSMWRDLAPADNIRETVWALHLASYPLLALLTASWLIGAVLIGPCHY